MSTYLRDLNMLMQFLYSFCSSCVARKLSQNYCIPPSCKINYLSLVLRKYMSLSWFGAWAQPADAC